MPVKPGLVCRKCRVKFPTMAQWRYHVCVPKKMERPAKKPTRRSR